MTPSEVVFNAIKSGFKTVPDIAAETFYSYDTIASAVRRLREVGVVTVTGKIKAPRRPLIHELALTGKPLHEACNGCGKSFELSALDEKLLCCVCRKQER